MKVLVSGASGLIGAKLVNRLRAEGHEVVRLVRKKTQEKDAIFWDPAKGIVPQEELEGFTAIVHLAGKNIASGRWTKKRKQELFQSRCRDTWLLAHAISRLKRPPEVFIGASAVGFYGDQGEAALTEEVKRGAGFLAEICEQWERASDILEEDGTRVVHVRFGAVLSPSGGMLKKLLPLFRMGLGSVLGDGEQWFSWIALDDAANALIHILKTPSIKGVVNVTAPECVRNKDFSLSLAKACGRPLFLRIPKPVLHLALGEMADGLLSSAKVIPQKLIQTGFVFRCPEIDSALNRIEEN